jgi:hypothetical protein
VTLKPDQVLAALKWSVLPDGRLFDPARIGFVEEPLALKGEGDATAEAVVERVTDTVVEVRTRSSVVSFLVLSDVFYPGWSVTIDGVPSRLYQTDYILRGAVVPAGTHLVRFAFTPRTFYAGVGITVLASVITIGIPIVGVLTAKTPLPYNILVLRGALRFTEEECVNQVCPAIGAHHMRDRTKTIGASIIENIAGQAEMVGTVRASLRSRST